MKTLNRLFVILAFLPANSVTAQEVDPARVGGRVLLLPSDRGLEGEIEKIGEQYRIRRGASEVWIPAEKGLRLCADWEEAFAFMKTRANLGDPEERLRLARWCQLNNLRSQALEEAKESLKMRPMHEETRQLVTMLTRTVASLQNSPTNLPQPSKTTVTPPASDISADAFALFATRVQPILMNTCVSCHSGGRGGDFQLIRTEGGQRGSTQANLAAVLAHLKVDNAVLSPLLIKAVSRHGNAPQAPIKDRKSIPFQTLQGWIEYLIANNPHLKNKGPDLAAEGRIPPGGNISERRGVSPPIDTLNMDTQKESPAVFGATREVQESRSNPQDSFDPAVFNRQTKIKK